ncbi:MAG: DoxX family protein [Fibrobacteria bacterium]|jgi:putative oxidoreductase|nr:DoxX family protein [Fibrobacteria bacterium]
MNTLFLFRNRFDQLREFLKTLDWLPPLAARVTLGVVFIEAGWGKLQHIDKVIGFFTALGLPAPAFQAHLVATSEFAFGILVLAGLFTRLAALPLSVIMIVAILTARREELRGFSDLAGFSEFLYLLLLLWLVIAGAGSLSLDRLLIKKRGRA